MGNFIALDVGGTFIKYGIISRKGQVLVKRETPTEASKGTVCLIHKIISLIEMLMSQDSTIEGIGISTAGIVDTEQGIIRYANENLPGYSGTRLKEIIENRFNIPVIVNNDVNAMALAEQWVGAGTGKNTFFCMTIGTGIGGAIVINGNLYKGMHFRAAEIGYLNKQDSQTCLETQASVSALIDRVKRELHIEEELDGIAIFSRAKNGDNAYLKIVEAWIEDISKGLANVICMFDPEMIIIGGGVSKQKKFLLDKIKISLPTYLPLALLEGIEIITAKCENDAGLIGAVYEFAKK